MNSSRLLCIIIGLQIVSLASQFLGQPTIISPAMAQMPDAGAQRAQIIEELHGMRADIKAIAAASVGATTRMEKIAAFLDSGVLQVRVARSDENKRPAGR